MQVPFTIEEFLNVLKFYNESVFPIQIIFYIIALYCMYLLFKQKKNNGKIISGFLSFIWLWIGIVYHIIFFSSINQVAYYFGVLFIIQGILFFIFGVLQGKINYEFNKNIFNNVGLLFISYALLVYPILGHILGHQYPYSPTFGLPCPTTIFTFGVLLFAGKRISVWLLVIPLLWSIIGISAAINLTIYEDFGLLIAGVIGFTLLLAHNHNQLKKLKTA